MVRTVVIVIALAMLAIACGRDHGTARVRPLPIVQRATALRLGGAARSPRIANYKIDARLDPTRHQIAATQTLTWTNSSETAVDKLPFHLYLNAFKNESTLFMRSGHGSMRGARASAGAWGWIQIESVQVGGVELASKLLHETGEDTVAQLPLPEPVQPGTSVDVTFKFTAQLPDVFARTGYKGEFHMVGQWFPKIGVLTATPGAPHWDCEPFHVNTEFFADFGVYDVSITVPGTYVVAATGVLAAATEAPGGTRTFTYHAEDVHDFAWMADPYMEVISRQARVEDGTVDVRVYYRPEQKDFANRHLEAAVGAIEKFSAALLPYPWPVMTVIDPPVDAAESAGGMEYPTLVTTQGDTVFARPGMRLPEYVTVHEVGHNWFQGILASNEAIEAWLDEGVNEWADGNVMNEMYGARTSAVDWLGWQAEIAGLRRAYSEDPAELPSPIAAAAYAFVDSEAYGEATYAKTASALSTLEQTFGPKKFAAAIKVYARTWAFKHPTGRDLFDVVSRELGEDLTWFFGPVFQRVGGIGLGIRTAECRMTHPARGIFGEGSARKTVTETEAPDSGSYSCEIVITNTGVVHAPVDIELTFEDGSTQRVHWDDRGRANWERFVIERSSKLVEVWIDPDNKLALASPMTHHYRIAGDGAAALRAAAWISSVGQTLMQIVGP